MKKFNVKKLVLSVSSVMALGVASVLPTSQASDIEIYRKAQQGDTTLMFMLDVSGSMTLEHGTPSVAALACDLPKEVLTKVQDQRTQRVFIGYNRFNQPVYEDRRINNTTEYEFNRLGITTKITDLTVNGVPYRKQQCVYKDKTYDDRITKVKAAMLDVLNGNQELKIDRIDDDKVVGLSTLGANNGKRYGTSDAENYMHGAILVPARKLSEKVDGNKTQREKLIEAIAKMEANSSTPTARSFAETVAYMFGTTTKHNESREGGWVYNDSYRMRNCTQWDASGNCTALNTKDESIETYRWNQYSDNRSRTTSDGFYYKGNFPPFGIERASVAESKTSAGDKYEQPKSLQGLAQKEDKLRGCSTQGIYVLTDGLPTNDTASDVLINKALNTNSFKCTHTNSFQCSQELSKILLNKDHANNLLKAQVKTAVVGFGSEFPVNENAKYQYLEKNDGETEQQAYERRKQHNLARINANIQDANVRAAAEWGVVGDGGWYSGNSSQDVVKSIASFLATLNTKIDTLPTGSPTIPVDPLNPQEFINKAYYASFTPRPEAGSQLWIGDMNEYDVKDGLLKGQEDVNLFNNDGTFNKNAKGIWSALNNLPIKQESGTLTSTRKLLTDRKINAGTAENGTALDEVSVAKLYNGGAFSNDSKKNYWLNLLGYDVSIGEEIRQNSLPTRSMLKQLGATMHSTPIMLTQEGKVTERGDIVNVTDRKDFLLYGSTQGLLHVIDVKTGVEKFAFVPNEMVENQADAFLEPKSTVGGAKKLFYGVDGAWTAHTLYTTEGDVTKVKAKNDDKTKAHQWVYGGLRMGGQSYYALDLTDMEKPEMKFHINPKNSSIYHAHNKQVSSYEELKFMGQSWSQPTLGYVNWRNADNKAEKRLVMFVGGGYDMGYEKTDYQQTNGVGAGVYMFDANTGELLWWASNNSVTGGKVAKLNMPELKYSVVSRINALDRDNDGLIDNLYFGDLAGQGFRIDLNNKAESGAPFGHRGVVLFDEHKADGTSPRFYEMPSLAVFSDGGGGSAGKHFLTASFVSGDRSSPYTAGTSPDPLEPDDRSKDKTLPTAQDGVFVVYDNDVNKHDLYKPDYKLLTTSKTLLENTLSSGVPRMAADGKTYNRGWKYIYPVNKTSAGSWKNIGTPRTFVSFLYVTAYNKEEKGSDGECGSGVLGTSYSVRFCLPTGQCTKERHGYTNSDSVMNDNGDKNKPNANKIGPGIVSNTLGGAGDTTVQVTGAIKDVIEGQIRPSISKIRWYESK